MQTVTLSSKGQLVIPKALRDQVQLSVGDELAVRVIGGEIRLRRLQMQAPANSDLEAVAGCLTQKGRKKLSQLQERQAIAQRLKSRDASSRNAASRGTASGA